MSDNELLEQIKKNIVHLEMSMMDAPYHSFSSDQIKGVFFAIKKVLDGTGLSTRSIFKELYENNEVRDQKE